MSHASPERYLVVDDDETFAERLAQAFIDLGNEARFVTGHEAALRAIVGYTPTRVTIDLRMPDGNGLATLEAVLARHPEAEALILTGYGSIPTAVDAVRMGAIGLVQKPVGVMEILAAFERAQQPPLAPETPDYETPSLARVEWDHIQRVLSDCGGNISQAARVLGMHRRTLQRKLQQHAPRK
jgi:two-component system response regulator RegA